MQLTRVLNVLFVKFEPSEFCGVPIKKNWWSMMSCEGAVLGTAGLSSLMLLWKGPSWPLKEMAKNMPRACQQMSFLELF